MELNLQQNHRKTMVKELNVPQSRRKAKVKEPDPQAHLHLLRIIMDHASFNLFVKSTLNLII